MRRLCILQMILTRGLAGSERHATELCNALAVRHEVHLVLRHDTHHRTQGVRTEEYVDRGRVRVHHLPRFLPRRYAVQRILATLRPDVVHTHLGRASRLVGALAASPPRVATLHIGYRAKDYARHEAIVCVAGWQLASLPPARRETARLIHNWVLPHPPLDDAARAALRAELGVAVDEYLIGSVGQLLPNKGFDLLIRAFHAAGLARGRLVIFGEGQERPRLEGIADQRVSLPGFTREPRRWLQCLDLFVVSSRFEPFSLVLLEAMDAGLPVVSTPADGPREILGRDAYSMTDSFEVDELAAVLRRAGAERPPRRLYDLSRFRIERAVGEVEALYREVSRAAGR